MTTAEMLASLEAQIRKDIPRLTELSEGCLVQNNDNKEIDVLLGYTSDNNKNAILKDYETGEIWIDYQNYFWINEYEDYAYSIIGHEIMLNDVLAWLNYIIYEKCIPINDLGYSGMVKQFYVKGDDGSIIFEILDLKNPDLGLDTIRYGVWNLSSPYLKDQPEKLIKFLYDLKQKIDE